MSSGTFFVKALSGLRQELSHQNSRNNESEQYRLHMAGNAMWDSRINPPALVIYMESVVMTSVGWWGESLEQTL